MPINHTLNNKLNSNGNSQVAILAKLLKNNQQLCDWVWDLFYGREFIPGTVNSMGQKKKKYDW